MTMFTTTFAPVEAPYSHLVEFRMHNTPTTCFTPEMLNGTLNWLRYWLRNNDTIRRSVLYTTSAHPSVFSLGGDLEFFSKANHYSLRTYAHQCIDIVEALHLKSFGQNISIAAVNGDAFGGGFELALAHDIIVAHPDAKFMFPEVHYGIFPGMGATSFLSRKLSERRCQELISTGEQISGRELFDLGVVTCLSRNPNMVARNMGQTFAENSGEYNKFIAIRDAMRRANPVTIDELRDTVYQWVDLALSVGARKHKRMAAAGRVQRSLGNY